jgi:DNA polymerase-3 subunit beta
MNLSCLQENLNRGLSIVGRAVPTRTTLPITNNVLLAAEESRLKLTATNLEMAITCWIGAMVEGEGAITVPARVLNEFVSTLPNDKIDMSLSDRVLELRCARQEARISGIGAADFPPIPKVEGVVTTKVDPEALRRAIAHVIFAAATEDTRPVLTGVRAEIEGNSMILAAADGFRLAVYTISTETTCEEKAEFIVPGRTLSELQRLLADQDEPVEIMTNPGKSQALFCLKSVEMVSQLLQGAFPNYQQLIPQSYGTRATVGTAEFLRAAKTAAIFARDASGIVRVYAEPGAEAGGGKITISARSEQVGENKGEIDARVEGEAAKIAFNAKYLIDVLSVLREEEVVLEATTPSSPGLISPVGSDNYVHVVMPMFVQW